MRKDEGIEFAVENYLHIADPTKWKCMLRAISPEGTIELMVLPVPVSRSRLHIEIRNAIYIDMYAGWRGLLLNVATKEELANFLPKLGSHLRQKLQDDYILDHYKLFVFLTDGRDKYFVAKDSVITQVLP
jgi:hypothetical protein